MDPDIANLYNIDNYTLITSNSCSRARLACYVSQNSSFKHKPELVDSALVDVIPMDNGTSRVIGVYRPFKLREGQTKRSSIEHLFTTLYDLSRTDQNIWIGSDFNINLERHSFETTKLREFIDELAFHSLVSAKTWERVITQPDGGLALRTSQIDHVFTNIQDSHVKIDDKWTSDHKLLILTTPILFPQLTRQKTMTRSWKNFNANNLNATINEGLNSLEEDKNSGLQSNDVNTLNKAINDHHKNSFDTLCPLRVVRTSRLTDIMSDSIKRIKKKRKRTLHKYNKSKDLELLAITKRLDIRLRSTIRDIKKSIVQQKLKSGNSKSFWNTVKKLQGEQKDAGRMELKINDKLVQDPQTLSDSFAEFFQGKVASLSQNSDQYCWARSGSTIEVTEREFDDALKSLKTKMCAGHDGIPLKLIKYGLPTVKKYALQLMQLAMQSIPTSWKTAVIVPLHKSGTKTLVENYRPIANLVSMSKVFEKIVLAKLDDLHPNIERQAQHSFRKNRGTHTALLELQHELASSLDKSLLVSAYSIDMSAAFDLLRPNIFHKSSDLNESLLNITMDFLSGRNFQVKVGDVLSSSRDLFVGCVQGSILGPKLFNIYCKDVAKALPTDARIIIYADDSYVVNVDSDFEVQQKKTSQCIETHTKMLRSIGMVVNSNKTELIFLSRIKDDKVMKIELEGSSIISKPFLKALGTIISNDLTWSRHINYVIRKSNHTIKRIRFLSKWLDKKNLLHLVTSQYFPVVFYSSSIWAGCLDYSSIKRLNSAHYRAIRAALRIRDIRSKSRKELDELSSRATLTQWLNYSLASTVIQLYNFSDFNAADKLRESAYINDRMPMKVRFFDTSKLKIGQQSLQNCIGHLFSKMSFDWITPLSNDALRVKLKNEFFNKPPPPQCRSMNDERKIQKLEPSILFFTF